MFVLPFDYSLSPKLNLVRVYVILRVDESQKRKTIHKYIDMSLKTEYPRSQFSDEFMFADVLTGVRFSASPFSCFFARWVRRRTLKKWHKAPILRSRDSIHSADMAEVQEQGSQVKTWRHWMERQQTPKNDVLICAHGFFFFPNKFSVLNRCISWSIEYTVLSFYNISIGGIIVEKGEWNVTQCIETAKWSHFLYLR